MNEIDRIRWGSGGAPMSQIDRPPLMDEIDRILLNPKNHCRVDRWFAWHPVRLGPLGNGRWVWLQTVERDRFCGIANYYEPYDEGKTS